MITLREVEEMERRFLAYARPFLNDVPEVSTNIQLKITHTLMVRRESRAISDAEGWPEEERLLGEVTALGHDFGRFEQFKRYRTFADAKSLNHGELSAELLEKERMLDFLSAADRTLVLQSVRWHNRAALPEGLSEREFHSAALVRDADKMDIMRVLLDYYANNCDNEAVTMGLKNVPEVTPAVADTLRAHRSPRYTDLHTIPDFVLTTLSWAYDLNFAYSKREFVRRGLLETMRPYIAEVPVALAIFEDVNRYLQEFDR